MPNDISIPGSTLGPWGFVIGADGDVKFDDTEAHAVVTSVLEEAGGYWADPTHGSDLHKLTSLTSRTPSLAENVAVSALQPLTQANAISGVDATATADRQRGRLNLRVSWTDPTGTKRTTDMSV